MANHFDMTLTVHRITLLHSEVTYCHGATAFAIKSRKLFAVGKACKYIPDEINQTVPVHCQETDDIGNHPLVPDHNIKLANPQPLSHASVVTALA